MLTCVVSSNSQDSPSIVFQIDEGCVRLATANTLLKLAKSQDNPVSADVYMQLALTMQVSLSL